MLPVLPLRHRRVLLRAVQDVLPRHHPASVAGDPEPVDVLRRQPDVVERELQDVAGAALRAGLLAVVREMNAGIEDLPRREQPVRVVDEAAVGGLQHRLVRFALGGLAVDERLALFRVDVEVHDERRARLVGARYPVVARVAVPGVGEPRERLTVAHDDEIELELAGLVPCVLAAESGEEFLPDGVGARVAFLRRGRHRESAEGQTSDDVLHRPIIFPAGPSATIRRYASPRAGDSPPDPRARAIARR